MNNLFDPTSIQELREIEKQTGQNLVDEIITEYQLETKVKVNRMRNHLNASQLHELSLIAHTLKSSSANVGAIGISHFCEEIESLIVKDKSKDIQKINSLVVQVENVLDETLQKLKTI